MFHADSEDSALAGDQEKSLEALSRDLERLAIRHDSTLYHLSSAQEETQSTTDDSISQATRAQYPRPADNIDKGKVTALQLQWWSPTNKLTPPR